MRGRGRGRLWSIGRCTSVTTPLDCDDNCCKATLGAIHLDFMVIVMDIGVSRAKGLGGLLSVRVRQYTVYRYAASSLSE